MKNGHFYSYTYGMLSLGKVREKVLSFMKEDPLKQYRLIIGSDSEPKDGKGTDFITALVVHRVGSGGIYFWRRRHEMRRYVLRTRMYEEAALSLNCADELLHVFQNDGIGRFDLEIHVDIGHAGETRSLITEIVGMIRGSGFPVKTKPHSYVASKVADRHT